MGLFIRKPFEALQAEANASGKKTLKRVLGPWSLVALGVGVIIGAGLFSITGTVAAGYTGPAITLSFAIAALGCCFAGLCYAEFASMIPVAGSAYTYSYATMGELIAFLTDNCCQGKACLPNAVCAENPAPRCNPEPACEGNSRD